MSPQSESISFSETRGTEQDECSHVYSICYFDRGYTVPQVDLYEAFTDEEVLEYARSSRAFTMREVWDRHRLVAVIPSSQTLSV